MGREVDVANARSGCRAQDRAEISGVLDVLKEYAWPRIGRNRLAGRGVDDRDDAGGVVDRGQASKQGIAEFQRFYGWIGGQQGRNLGPVTPGTADDEQAGWTQPLLAGGDEVHAVEQGKARLPPVPDGGCKARQLPETGIVGGGDLGCRGHRGGHFTARGVEPSRSADQGLALQLV